MPHCGIGLDVGTGCSSAQRNGDEVCGVLLGNSLLLLITDTLEKMVNFFFFWTWLHGDVKAGTAAATV